jgi:short-subunit dehydrogenase
MVTGASSGFGIDFARGLAKRGYDLILVARREEQLRAVASEIERDYGRGVRIYVADLAVAEQRTALAEHVATFDAPLEVLVNNAGLGLYGPFASIPWEKEKQMLDVDIDAVVHLCKLLVPGMVAQHKGFVLNVASIGAYQPTPLYASYSAAKAFILSFSQALDFELRKSGVSVTVVSPGVAATEFLNVSKQRATFYQRRMMMSSEAVVASALRALFARRATVVPGFLNALTAYTAKISPGSITARLAYAVMRSNEPVHE